MSPLADRIDVARGLRRADLLLKNARVLSPFSGEVYDADVVVAEGMIVGIGRYSEGENVHDLKGRHLLPGLIEGHMHIESSLLSPPEFARTVIPHGTTTAVVDPHEIANVLGEKGIRYLLESTRNLPMDILLMIPSCVPATPLETAGACLGPAQIEEMLGWERTLGLAEVMNFPGVFLKDPEVLQKLEAARRLAKKIDGHCPGLSGADLDAYLAAGPSSDHECTSLAEAEEKLRKGMYVMVREGSAAKNLKDLLPMMNGPRLRRILLVSDDRHPQDLLQEGHLDSLVRYATSLGLPVQETLSLVTLNPAECFGLKDRGAIAPNYQADLIVVDDLTSFRVEMVFKGGMLVAREGELLAQIPRYSDSEVEGTVRISPLHSDAFRLRANGGEARVIEIIPDQIVTRSLWVQPRVVDGDIVQDPERDILKLAVIERHHASGRIGLGLVKGFGLQLGALASSVAHDSHNLIVVGTNDPDMRLAAQAIAESGGGFVAVAGRRMLAQLPLPIAGLMSDLSASQVVAQLRTLLDASRSIGCRLDNPFIALSFLALPVIPQLKLTDRGLVDVETFSFVPLGHR